jgi:hypothetical protein
MHDDRGRLGILTSNFKGFGMIGSFQREVRLYERVSEGYGTGEFFIDHLTLENLQELADWMITLPAELYVHVEHLHRPLESFLLDRRKRD